MSKRRLHTGVYLTDRQSEALAILDRAIELNQKAQLLYDPNEAVGCAFQVVCAGLVWWPADENRPRGRGLTTGVRGGRTREEG